MTTMGLRHALVVVAVIAAPLRPAHAEDARVAAARTAYEAQEQERTLSVLAPATLAALGDHDRAAALRLIGCAHMVLGERDAAITAFRESFALEPDAALEADLASPDARSLFEVARGEWRAALVTDMAHHADDVARLQVAVKAPAKGRGGEPIAVGVTLVDPAQLAARVELGYRRRGQAGYTLMTQRVARPLVPVTFAIPADATESSKPFVLEYHVTVRHTTGLDLRRDGDPDRPHVIDVAAGHKPRWYQSWWVRGAIAAGVVGLAAGGYLLYRSIDVGPQDVVVHPP